MSCNAIAPEVGLCRSPANCQTAKVTTTHPLDGRVIVVTGASSGIGEATARLLHELGARPVLAARRRHRIDSIAAQLGGALAVETDVTVASELARLVHVTLERHERIDGLVNNAGAALHERVAEVDLERFRQVIELNVVAVVAAMQAVVPVMRAQGHGRIVNVSSGTTRMVPEGAGPYAATKAAVNMLSAVARKELAPENIIVSCVLPSVTATEFRGGAYQNASRLGLVAHDPAYVAKVIVRALVSGEEMLVIPHGAEDPELAGS